MKVVDIHPEELIDKLSAGELSGVERERLDAHLAQCSSCRFEIGVRADLAEDAPPFDQRPQLTFAGRQVTPRPPQPAAGGPLSVHGAPAAPASIRPRSRRRWPLVLLAASLVLCAGGATAAVLTGAVAAPPWLHWAPGPKPARAAMGFADSTSAHKPKRALKPAAPSVTSDVVPAPAVLASTAEASSAPGAAPLPLVLRPRAVVASRALPVPRAAVVVNQAPSVAAFPPEPAPAQGASEPAQPAVRQLDPVASLFADANRARRDGNLDRAVALYRSLQARYPSSSESELSRALLAQLLLDRGSPEAALAGFDRYLAQDAPVLGAEALVGRARALEQLGKPEQAAAAWRQVQSRFPGSVHARLAATRLAALGMR